MDANELIFLSVVLQYMIVIFIPYLDKVRIDFIPGLCIPVGILSGGTALPH